jgi:short-subunit dehydrogenase
MGQPANAIYCASKWALEGWAEAVAYELEPVDLKDLVSFARNFHAAAPDALERIVQFAEKVMSNVGAADLVRRVQSLARGNN